MTLDPHKWLYQPIECGALLVREGRLLAEAFTINPDYLADYKSDEVNFSDLRLQLTRVVTGAEDLAVDQLLRRGRLPAAIDRAIELALLAEDRSRRRRTSSCCRRRRWGSSAFRRRFDGVEDEDTLERLNAGLVTAFEAEGSRPRVLDPVGGQVRDPDVRDEPHQRPGDVDDALDWFATAPRPALPVTPGPGRPEDRHPDVRGGWADAGDFDPGRSGRCRSSPGWMGRARDGRRAGRELRVAPGDTVIHRWHGTRHFYVIVAGTVEIRGLDGPVPELGPGEFFGELAALDWGAGFGYARTADVVASSAARLLVLAPATLGELLRRAPELEATLRAVARERLGEI